jgi:2-isopropylmalate synthase
MEKMEIAHALARMGVDVIEAGFPISSPEDFESVKAIAQEVKGPVIAGLARTKNEDIDRCWEAVKHSDRPRIHTFIATSDVHVEKKLRKSREEVIEIAVNAVKRAKGYCEDVEFSPEDAARTDIDYMCKIIEAVIDAGATTINIPDTVGYSNPWEFGDRIRYVFKHVPNVERAVISVHCHNDLGLAVANSLAAVKAGAGQVECTINGIGERAGNASLEEIVMNIHTRKDFFGFTTGINTTQIYRASRLVSNRTGMLVQPNKAIVGSNAFAHEAGIHQDGVLKERTTYEIMTPESVGWKGTSMVLGKHSGRHAFRERLEQLGYQLDSDVFEKAFERFKILADKKKEIYDADLATIVADESRDIPERFHLEGFSVMSGTATKPTATVRLRIGDEVIESPATGDGPVDAALNAVKEITGTKSTLTSFNIQAVTRGADALGEVMVTIEEDGNTAVGRGSSTDIIDASVKAYLDALNRMEHQRGRKAGEQL